MIGLSYEKGCGKMKRTFMFIVSGLFLALSTVFFISAVWATSINGNFGDTFVDFKVTDWSIYGEVHFWDLDGETLVLIETTNDINYNYPKVKDLEDTVTHRFVGWFFSDGKSLVIGNNLGNHPISPTDPNLYAKWQLK